MKNLTQNSLSMSHKMTGSKQNGKLSANLLILQRIALRSRSYLRFLSNLRRNISNICSSKIDFYVAFKRCLTLYLERSLDVAININVKKIKKEEIVRCFPEMIGVNKLLIGNMHGSRGRPPLKVKVH